jgi:penicillin-binding protein 1C
VKVNKVKSIYLLQPTHGLQLAMDPRIPDNQEAFTFKLANLEAGAIVDWYVDNRVVASTSKGEYLWALQRGSHLVKARYRQAGSGKLKETATVRFLVK